MGESINMSKRKHDLLASTKELAKGIGPRIRALREKREMNQHEFYDFLFPESEYQTMGDDASPKTEGMKNKDIGEIESGKVINISGTPFNKETGLAIHLALLLRISEKCGVSLDYLIAGKDFRPEGASCPPEEKAISGGDVVEPFHTDMEIPPEEKWKYDEPYNEYLKFSDYDICKSLVALSYITDMEIVQDGICRDGRINPGVLISITPKEIVLPVNLVKSDNGISSWEIAPSADEFSTAYVPPDEKTLALHLFDTRGRGCIQFLHRLLKIESMYGDDGLCSCSDNINIITESIDNTLSDMVEQCSIETRPLIYAIDYGADIQFFLNACDDDIFDDRLRFETEPYSVFKKRQDSK